MMGFETVTWNFTEASHGKGTSDGVGGALKNLADRLVAYGTDIPNASALLEDLSKQSSVRLFEVTEENITKCGELVAPSLKSVPGTMKVHQVSTLFLHAHTNKFTFNLSPFLSAVFHFCVFLFCYFSSCIIYLSANYNLR